jgi:hypothetical protein
MKKVIVMGLLALGIVTPTLHGATIIDAVNEVVELASIAPQAADRIKANLATMKQAVKDRKVVDALGAAEQILTHTANVIVPTSRLLAALGDVNLIKSKVPKITEGTLKIKDMANSLQAATNQFAELVELAQLLQ